MYLKGLELVGFKSFAKKSELLFNSSITAIVGPNGSGKSNVAEAFRFVLGEQSIKSMRGKKGEDLIFNGSQSTGRANRAMVKVVFDNSGKLFNVDFDEVSVERTVYRDGVNEYSINGSKVRLRDVVELLAQANIGASGHHIISQGEADRILSASPRERREMIEDALGLKVYKYKLEESQRKLEKTEENLKQVELLRKEIAPHLKFLGKQVEKIEKALALREELKVLYRDYLSREHIYISHEKKAIAYEKKGPEEELRRLTGDLEKARKTLTEVGAGDEKSSEVLSLEAEMSKIRGEKESVSRMIGRLEGEIAFEKRREEEGHTAESVPIAEIEKLAEDLKKEAREAEGASDIPALRSLVGRVVGMVERFVSGRKHAGVRKGGRDLKELEAEHEEAEKKLKGLSHEEEKLGKRYQDLRKEIESAKNESREAERAVFSITSVQSELRAKIAALSMREDALRRLSEEFERELHEGAVLVGREILSYEKETPPGGVEGTLAEGREKQEERRRTIERIKIRLEESGAGSSDEVMKEYHEVRERSEYLEKEVGDLERSAETLQKLIEELTAELREEFSGGIAKINKEFQNFFSLMFGGGNASLQVIEEVKRRRPVALDEGEEAEEEDEIEKEEGIDIAVSLPRKKIKGLMMLSGGERALTSIALLFAMSQVNPPPFLILDETDAALDEANSKRYGDMIENLSKYSQLILITHNRETMSRAGILYGVTMGSDGISKLLSVKFEEAVQVAK